MLKFSLTCLHASLWKDLEKSLDAAIGCDAFFTMLKSPSQHKMKLLSLATGLLGVSRPSEDIQEFPEPLVGFVDRLVTICSSIICLLSPIPELMESKPSHVQAILSYKGTNANMVMLKTEMTRSKEWSKLWDEVLAKHASSKHLWPDIVKALESLKQETPDHDTMMSVCSKITDWKKVCREGMLEELESALGSALHLAANDLLAKNGQGASMHLFGELQKGLQMFLDQDSFNLCGRVAKLQGKVGADIWVADLTTLLETYPKTCDEAKGALDTSGELLQKLNGLFQMQSTVAGTLSESVRALLEPAVFWHFRDLFIFLRETWQRLGWGVP